MDKSVPGSATPKRVGVIRKTIQVIMAKVQDPICVLAQANNHTQDLIRRRANAKLEVDHELKHMSPLLKVNLEDAYNMVNKFGESIEKLKALIVDFELAHANYMG